MVEPFEDKLLEKEGKNDIKWNKGRVETRQGEGTMKIFIKIAEDFPKEYLFENSFDLKEILTKVAISKIIDDGQVLITLKKEKGFKRIEQKLVKGEYENSVFCTLTKNGNVVIDFFSFFYSEDWLKCKTMEAENG